MFDTCGGPCFGAQQKYCKLYEKDISSQFYNSCIIYSATTCTADSQNGIVCGSN